MPDASLGTSRERPVFAIDEFLTLGALLCKYANAGLISGVAREYFPPPDPISLLPGL
ncbi:MAG TPA: hypothetical protein VGQ52_04030 [Gemmatimonadaceae bacterium]|nr:hypothetical protein [Gemmatimonadaceae bacterium]